MTRTNPYIKQYLMTGGPTPVPPRVYSIMAEPILYHRAPVFEQVFARVLDQLPYVFQTQNPVLAYTASGTGAMESAVANLVREHEPVLVCSAGKFGERWLEQARSYGGDVVSYEPGWGQRLDPNEIDQLLDQHPQIRVAFATLCETSTAIVHDIQAIAEVARAHDVILAVDAVSGLGAAELCQDEWGVDVVVAGSEKALMCPPGLAFVSVSDRALDYAAAQPQGRYYFDWHRTLQAQQKGPTSPFTPAVTLFMGQDVALGMIKEEGLPQVFARHALLAQATRAGARALGLELFGDPDDRANVVTAIELPETIDGAQLPRLLRDRYGITASGGQDSLKGRIVRLAHCGYFGAFDILTALAGIELALRDLGVALELGAGVGAAQQVFLDAGVAIAASSA